MDLELHPRRSCWVKLSAENLKIPRNWKKKCHEVSLVHFTRFLDLQRLYFKKSSLWHFWKCRGKVPRILPFFVFKIDSATGVTPDFDNWTRKLVITFRTSWPMDFFFRAFRNPKLRKRSKLNFFFGFFYVKCTSRVLPTWQLKLDSYSYWGQALFQSDQTRHTNSPEKEAGEGKAIQGWRVLVYPCRCRFLSPLPPIRQREGVSCKSTVQSKMTIKKRRH